MITIALFPGDIVTVNGNDVITCGKDVSIMLKKWIETEAENLQIVITQPYQSFDFVRDKGY